MQESNQNMLKINPVDLKQFCVTREGEVKLGERVNLTDIDSIDQVTAQYVLLGIPEDIGPRANCGNPGSDRAWHCFLKKFLNIQNNHFINAEDICILGSIDCSDLMLQSENAELPELRKLVGILDDRVSKTIEVIVSNGKTPIVIGGGHNNAYGIIKGVSLALEKPISVVNCDPHADFRAMEGRHSGNGFTYANHEGFMDSYHVIGAHQSYNSEFILSSQSDKMSISYLDDMLANSMSFSNYLVDNALNIKADQIGLELDLDSIINMPSSAQGPSGITVNEAREYIMYLSELKQCHYLHLPEASPDNTKLEGNFVGKTLAYLVSDFIKHSQKTPN